MDHLSAHSRLYRMSLESQQTSMSAVTVRALRNQVRSQSFAVGRSARSTIQTIPLPKYDFVALLVLGLSILFFLPLMWGANVSLDIDVELEYLTSGTTITTAACALSICSMLLIDVLLDYIFVSNIHDSHLNLRFISVFTLMCSSIVFIIASTHRQFSTLVHIFDALQIFLEFSMLFWLLQSLDTRNYFTTTRVNSFVVIFFGYNMTSLLSFVLESDALGAVAFVFVGLFSMYYIFVGMRWLIVFLTEHWSKEKSFRNISLNDGYSVLIILSTIAVGFAFYGITFMTHDVISYTVGIHIMRTALTVSICLLPGRMYRQKAITLEYDAEVKTSFVRYMSHELRTPMSVLTLGLELLSSQLESGRPAVELQHTVAELENCCFESTTILDNLLLYEKLHTNKLELKKEELPFVTLICDAVSPLQRAICSAGLKLSFLEAPNTNVAKLRQVCVNVDKGNMMTQLAKVVNMAIDEAKHGGELDIDAHAVIMSEPTRIGHFKASSVAPSHAPAIRISITMPHQFADDERKYFESTNVKFQRAANNGGGGMELSVYILLRIAALHGGHAGLIAGDRDVIFIDIPVEAMDASMVDQSGKSLLEFQESMAKYVSKVPSTRIAPDAATSAAYTESGPAPPLSESIVSSAATGGKMRLLVVDDSDMARKMVMKVMQSLGHECNEANDGNVAVEMMEAAILNGERYDAVLLDNEMPIMRGRDAVRKMREMKYHGIVLGVTGNAMEEDIVDFKANGANDVVLKPLTTAKFKIAMDPILPTNNTTAAVESGTGTWRVATVAVTTSDSAKSAPPDSATNTKMRLLVVDDSDSARKMVMKVMQSLGHECNEANDGNVAVEMMEAAMSCREVYDAVLLDNEMPIMRGRDAVRKMREMKYHGIVLGVTGNAMEEDIVDFKANGANDVVLKPLTTAKFKAAMDPLLGNKQ